MFFSPIPKKSRNFGHRKESFCSAAQKSGFLRKIRRFSPEFWVYPKRNAVYAQSSGARQPAGPGDGGAGGQKLKSVWMRRLKTGDLFISRSFL